MPPSCGDERQQKISPEQAKKKLAESRETDDGKRSG
jgi:hypothetical protein